MALVNPAQKNRGTHQQLLHFFKRVRGLSVGFTILTGTQPPPHNGVTTLPTRICAGLALDWVGSIMTVLPTAAISNAGSNFPNSKQILPH